MIRFIILYLIYQILKIILKQLIYHIYVEQ